jgi:hypothetical protein
MKKILLGILLLLVVGAGLLFAINGKDSYDPAKYSAKASNGLQEGSTLSFKLPDQFDHAHTLGSDTKKLIVVFAKETGHTVKEFLKEEPADYLEKHHALFIADISPMPVVIRNTFALPDLKKQHYSVLLIYDKTISKDFKKGTDTEKIAVVTLDHGKVTKLSYVEDDEDLKKALEQ